MHIGGQTIIYLEITHITQWCLNDLVIQLIPYLWYVTTIMCTFPKKAKDLMFYFAWLTTMSCINVHFNYHLLIKLSSYTHTHTYIYIITCNINVFVCMVMARCTINVHMIVCHVDINRRIYTHMIVTTIYIRSLCSLLNIYIYIT